MEKSTLKTLKQIWGINSGLYAWGYPTKEKAIAALAEQSFLDQFEVGAVLQIVPMYQVVDFEVPGTEYYNVDR